MSETRDLRSLEMALRDARELAGLVTGEDPLVSWAVELHEELDEALVELEHQISRLTLPTEEIALAGELDLEPPGVCGGIIDLRGWATPDVRPKRKWYHPDVPIGTVQRYKRRTLKRGVMVHNTGVARMGPWKSRVKLWREHLQKRLDCPGVTVRDFPEDGDLAVALAVADRLRGFPSRKGNYGLPYHGVYSAKTLFLNLPFDWVTWHGDGGNNEFLGYARDGLPSDTLDVEAERAALEAFIEEAELREGHIIEEFTCHGCWTRKPHDPGRPYVETVLLPVAEEYGLEVDMDFKTDGGISIAEMLKL